MLLARKGDVMRKVIYSWDKVSAAETGNLNGAECSSKPTEREQHSLEVFIHQAADAIQHISFATCNLITLNYQPPQNGGDNETL